LEEDKKKKDDYLSEITSEYEHLLKTSNEEHELLFKKSEQILDYKRVLFKQQKKIKMLEQLLHKRRTNANNDVVPG
jgi:hypothetical protein